MLTVLVMCNDNKGIKYMEHSYWQIWDLHLNKRRCISSQSVKKV